jgi:hypothetical protein
LKLEKQISRKLIKDGIISLFLYALPILLMLLYFYLKGEQPWKKRNANPGFNITDTIGRSSKK